MTKITAAWGLIVILATDKLSSKYTVLVYTLYGDLIEKSVFSRPITAIATFTSNSEIDYLLIGDANGIIHMCEAVYPTRKQVIYKVVGHPIAIDYDSAEQKIIFVTKSGEIFTMEKEWF